LNPAGEHGNISHVIPTQPKVIPTQGYLGRYSCPLLQYAVIPLRPQSSKQTKGSTCQYLSPICFSPPFQMYKIITILHAAKLIMKSRNPTVQSARRNGLGERK